PDDLLRRRSLACKACEGVLLRIENGDTPAVNGHWIIHFQVDCQLVVFARIVRGERQPAQREVYFRRSHRQTERSRSGRGNVALVVLDLQNRGIQPVQSGLETALVLAIPGDSRGHRGQPYENLLLTRGGVHHGQPPILYSLFEGQQRCESDVVFEAVSIG